MIIMRLSSCCTQFLIFSRLHRRTSPAAEVCSHRRTSLAAVACLQPSPHQSSRGSLQQKPHQPSGGSSQPLPQRWGGTARIMHRTGPAAVVRSHRCNSTACRNHHTSRGSSQPLPHRASGSSSQPLRAAPVQPRQFAAAEDNSHHRSGPAAEVCRPGDKVILNFLFLFSYLLFLCLQTTIF